MPRKRKKKGAVSSKKPESTVLGPFNPALRGLASLKKREDRSVRPAQASEKRESLKKEEDSEDMRYFRKAMADVEPLKRPNKRITKLPDANIRPAHPAPDEEQEALAHLSNLVFGKAFMDITFSDEYIEGSVQGISPRIMQKLRKGEFPVQGHLDLHGLTKQEAEQKVARFIMKSHRLGLRCVLVVHGRGLNSENDVPVLKERLPKWLNSGPVRKVVLAFSTARPYDGGAGAVYILLRRRKGRKMNLR